MDFTNSTTNTMARPVSRVEVMNAFMRGIYNWMALALAVTTIVSLACLYTPLRELVFTPTGMIICIVALIVELIMGFTLAGRLDKMAPNIATTLFIIYSALQGFTLSFIISTYTPASVAQAFVATTCTFGAMSLYGLYTKRDLTSWGAFLSMAVMGLVIAMIVNLVLSFFMPTNMLSMGICFVGVIIFLGLTAYETQLFREMGESIPHDDPVAVRRATLFGAFNLYLNFINLFIMILRLIGNRE